MKTRQENITRWLTNINNISVAKPYFFLDWDMNNMLPINQATWYDILPTDKKIRWKKIIKIGYRDIVLCSTFIPLHCSEIKSSTYDTFLISHLQKSIRRKKNRSSIYTADLLLEISPLKLIRRLPIIMIEDTYCHESFTTLVWLMCLMIIKKENYCLHENQKRWILGVVYLMSILNYNETIYYDKLDFIFSNNLTKIHNIKNKNIQDIIYSLETKRCYGKIKNDDLMFQSYINKYLEGFQYETDIWKSIFFIKIKPILTKKIKFQQKEWLLEGYDFHCNRFLLTSLTEEYPEYTEEEHKDAIWYESSSVNFRNKITYNVKIKKYEIVNKIDTCYDIKILWNNIKKSIRRKAFFYIIGMLENLNTILPDMVKYVPYEKSVPLEKEEIYEDNN